MICYCYNDHSHPFVIEIACQTQTPQSAWSSPKLDHSHRYNVCVYPPPNMTTCKKCGQPLPEDRENASSGPLRVFCSDRCYHLWHKNENKKRKFRKNWLAEHGMEYPLKACLECGAPFNALAPNGKTRALRCSDECKKAHLTRYKQDYSKGRYVPSVQRGSCWYCLSDVVKTGRGQCPSTCSEECELHRKQAKRFGLTREEYIALPKQCEICGEPAYAIDHCHDSNKVRGHLCNNCNSGLGFFGDNPGTLLAAWVYLTNHK